MAAADPDKKKERIKLAAAIGIFMTAGGVAWYMLSGDTLADTSAKRVFICAETGRTFDHTVTAGEEEPVYSPHSKQKTGFEAEKCYWTRGDAEGEWKAKTTPTYVLWLKKPTYVQWKHGPDAVGEEDTYCPDCGHLVVGHNPKPPQELMDAAAAEGR